MASMEESSSIRLATREVLTEYLGEVFHSGCPKPSQIRPKRRSLPPPKRMSPSRVLYER